MPLLVPLVLFVVSCEFRSQSGPATERTRWRQDERDMTLGIRAGSAEGVAMGFSTSELRFVQNIAGFQGPESVKYDPGQDVWFVTNQAGPGSDRDGNGYIARVPAGNPDSASVFVQGGSNGVELHAPKGTALHGDTLWVTDIDHLRGFDRRTGAPLANLDFRPQGAVQLNDIDIGPDGTIHVTDTGIIMSPKGVIWSGPSRIFIVGAGVQVTEMRAPTLQWPNGIKWDASRDRWIVVSFDPFHGRVHALPRDGGTAILLRDGTGKLDGVEVLPDGSILFTSWADSSLHMLKNGSERVLLREIPEAADFGIDTKRNRIAIPLAVLGRVQLWSLAGLR